MPVVVSLVVAVVFAAALFGGLALFASFRSEQGRRQHQPEGSAGKLQNLKERIWKSRPPETRI